MLDFGILVCKIEERDMKKTITITDISWLDDNYDSLTSLPNEVNLSYVRFSNILSDSDEVWKYLFERFGAFPEQFNVSVI
jgi:hypothetical protein